MPFSRRRVLLSTPVVVGLGVLAIVGAFADHGASDAVIGGVVGGALFGVALLVAIGAYWHAPVETHSVADQQCFRSRLHGVYVPIGLTGAGVASGIPGLGDGGASVAATLTAGCGVFFAALGLSCLVLAVGRPELWR